MYLKLGDCYEFEMDEPYSPVMQGRVIGLSNDDNWAIMLSPQCQSFNVDCRNIKVCRKIPMARFEKDATGSVDV